MVFALKCLIDTNILLRIARQNDPLHHLVQLSLQALDDQSISPCFSLQNIAEFWNVCTRPVNRNGFGLSIAETSLRVEYIERTMTFLPDTEQVYAIWRNLVVTQNVRGVQVHDARLAALMQAYGISRILTLNDGDFLRFANIQPIHPSQLQV
jgi:predicted nucleic acid-binding protein